MASVLDGSEGVSGTQEGLDGVPVAPETVVIDTTKKRALMAMNPEVLRTCKKYCRHYIDDGEGRMAPKVLAQVQELSTQLEAYA